VADIFSVQPGKVVAVKANGLPLQIIIGNPAFVDDDTGVKLPDSTFRGVGINSFKVFKAVVQNLGISGQSGVQFRHTLQDYIYVYVFGERAGDLSVGGLAFHSACDDADNEPTGFEMILDYYKNFRVTSYPQALTVAIGTLVTFDAFLVGVNAQIVNPETNLAQFTLQLKYIPGQVDLIPEET
jgi:hypothetical protein